MPALGATNIPRRIWIIRHGYHTLVQVKPRKWADSDFYQFRDLSHGLVDPIGYAPVIADRLDWGPQHVDLDQQEAMRSCYFKGDMLPDAPALRLSLKALQDGAELVLWGDVRLQSCLGMLWALDWLISNGANPSRLSLALDPRPYPSQDAGVAEFRELLDHRIPLEGITQPLLDIRRFIASDFHKFELDLSGVSGSIREWLELLRHLADFLPDDRGLDRFDDRLMEHLTTEWQRVAYPIANTLLFCPKWANPPDGLLWLRLVELSAHRPLQSSDSGRSRPLCELEPNLSDLFASRVRISSFGKSVRSGRVDALKHRHFYRWMGGRLITNDRLLRFPGTYRNKNYRGTIDPQSLTKLTGEAGGGQLNTTS